jgi:hypothetical protein
VCLAHILVFLHHPGGVFLAISVDSYHCLFSHLYFGPQQAAAFLLIFSSVFVIFINTSHVMYVISPRTRKENDKRSSGHRMAINALTVQEE